MFVVFCMTGCGDEGDNDYDEIIKEDVSIKNTDTYLYDLGSFGDEESASIQKQAKHFEISELNREAYTGKIIYTYKPKAGFTGTDYVEILTGRGSDGASANNILYLIRINIKISTD